MISLRRLTIWRTAWTLSILATTILNAQNLSQTSKHQAETKKTIDLIELAVQNNEIGNLSSALAREVTINIRGGESGLFSNNQAIMIIRSHFSSKNILQFKFSSKNFSREPFYASGGGIWRSKGISELFQIYAGLSVKEGRIVISQFNIY